MKNKSKEIWLFSQYLEGPGGTHTVTDLAKKILSEEGINYHHAWVTNFSANQKNKGELYFKALPIPTYFNHILAGLKWKLKLRKRPALVVGGNPISAAIPFAAGIPYVIWMGPTMFDEYKVRSLKEELSKKNYSLFLNKLFLNLNKMIEYRVLKETNFIIVQSSYMIRSITRDYNIDESKIEYLPYPMSVKSQQKEKPFNRKGPRLLAVGRINDTRKNFPLLLKAFALVIKEFPEAHLGIVGKISKDRSLLKLCSELRLGSLVTFLGEITDKELIDEYENANIFVLTPRQEGLGLVYLEAMSYGLPVVTTKCGGPEGVVIDGLNGYLVEQNNPEAFASAVEEVWKNEEHYKRLSNQARDYVLKFHNPEKFTKRFVKIMQNKLGFSDYYGKGN